ncbi:MAG: Trm112 family protein [Propionibacteriaceae bacterium]|jgi:uncharacterized protein YbaR (Trm112 family)|nr:Trm112 family protein [Propionibacteriaceae bacterium]
MTVELDPALLEILACPQCHSNVSIDYEAEEIVCVGLSCGLAFPIKDNIPIMLTEEARPAVSAPSEREEGSVSIGLADLVDPRLETD